MIKTLIILLIISSCTAKARYTIGRNYLPEKAFGTFKKELATASPEFQRGWGDGCEVGSAAGSVNTFYQMFYRSNAVDGYAKANDPDYRSAWENSFWYCARYEEIKQTSSIWGSMFRGYQ